MNAGNEILVYAELNGKNEIDQILLECLGMAKMLADESGCGLSAVLVGCDIHAAAEELIHYSVDSVYLADVKELKEYHPELFLPVLKNLCLKTRPRMVILGNTLTGLDLAPRLSFALGAGLVTDCIGITIDDGRPVYSKPVYSGNVIAEYDIRSDQAIVTVRARTQVKADRLDSYNGRVIPIPEMIGAGEAIVQVVKRVVEEEDGPQLENADIIVAGGRGVGGKEGFTVLANLARTMGAALGASRPPCDLGWINSNAQVGQTGEIVGPSIYIAVGISGSTQHIVGMYSSKTIIAINRDSQAPIFDIADYGIVGNYEDIIPSFSNALIAE